MPSRTRSISPLALCCCVGLGIWSVQGASALAAPAAPSAWTGAAVRRGQLELGPSTSLSIDRSLRQAVLLGVRLSYQLTDRLALGLDVGYGVGLDTGLTGELERRYERDPAAWADLSSRFSTIRLAGDLRLTVTVLTGKLGIVSRVFLAYDQSLFTGAGIALLSNGFTGDADADATSEGVRLGPALGLGLRVFLSRSLVVGLELRELVFQDNESGGDLTRGMTEAERAAGASLIDGEDQRLSSHLFVGLRFTVLL